MSSMSYLSAIERYHELRASLHELLASIVTGIADTQLLDDEELQARTVRELSSRYPFIDMLYLLNTEGIQVSANILGNQSTKAVDGKGTDRSQRPYFKQAQNHNEVVVTEPYFSSVLGNVCLSPIVSLRASSGAASGYLVLDIDLVRAIEFLMGDTARRKYQPLFRAVYGAIIVGLFSIVGVLLVMALSEVVDLVWGTLKTGEHRYKPFSVIVYLTLALAIFDLGKTILEEEILMHKDIFRHSSTRRTITRFIAAILIAVSIESLLLMFKSALESSELLVQAVWLMLAAVALLIGLGLYVYLGAKAEGELLRMRRGNEQTAA